MGHQLVLEETPNGLQVTYEHRRLYGRNPEDDAARRIRSTTIPPDTLVLWLSPVLWHGWGDLRPLLSRGSAVIAVEADPVLLELSGRRYPGPDEDLVLSRAVVGDVVRALRDLGQHRFRRLVEISTTGSALLHREAYRALRDTLDREIRVFWQNRLTISQMGRLWLRNLIRNVPSLACAAPLCVQGGPAPAVVCGAGPSLERALPFLSEHRPRFALIAVDTALPVLASHGLSPDLVIGLEGQLANAYDFLPVSRRDYGLLADLTSCPVVPELHLQTSWSFTAFAPFTIMKRVRALPGISLEMPPLGSVGVSAAFAALELGASPVFFTGLDFAVLPGKTHARGAPSFLHGFIHSDRLHRMIDPGIGARLIDLRGALPASRTTLVLKGYADELAALLRRRNDCYVLAPTGIDIAAVALTAEEATTLLDSTPAGTLTSEPAPLQAASRARLASFIQGEIQSLSSLEDDIDSVDRLPESVDYLACEVPDRVTRLADRVDVLPLDRSSRSRIRAAARYYRRRWASSLAILENGHPTTPRS
ncbi:MAG: 6-hydroxymethylpterin diphosphokinase MptE-like protein [Spirochaetota bacterium]